MATYALAIVIIGPVDCQNNCKYRVYSRYLATVK